MLLSRAASGAACFVVAALLGLAAQAHAATAERSCKFLPKEAARALIGERARKFADAKPACSYGSMQDLIHRAPLPIRPEIWC
jgi:hypothetical protein